MNHLSRAALCVALLAVALSSGCMTGKLPSAAFSGMTVQTVQSKPGAQDMKLKVGFDFKVKNPLGIKLVVPDHTFGLEIDGKPVAETGTRRGFDVAKGSAKKVRYDFTLDLSEKGLGRAFGKDATFAFTADANIDVPQKIFEILEDIPGSSVVPDAAKGAGQDLVTTGLEALKSADSNGIAKAKLTFAHEGSLKLAKFPKLKAAGDGKPNVALVGTSETMNLDNVIGELTKDVEPLALFLEQFENAAMNQQVDIPVGELLERIGVPANLTSAALTAINGVLQLNGKQAIGSKNNTVSVPVQLPKLSALLGTLDPKAGQKIDAFTGGWTDFKSNPALGSLVIPTALPQGIRVATPFAIENPNEFLIHAPTFKLGLVAADGTPVALVAVGAPTDNSAALGSTRSTLVKVNAQGDAALELISEFNWDKLGADLLGAAASGSAPDLSGLRLMGEVSIDPGYGPITVPLNIPLAPPTTSTGGSSSSKAQTSGKSESSGSSSKGSGSTSTKGKGDSSSTSTKSKSDSGSTSTKTKSDSGSTSTETKGSKGSKGTKGTKGK